MKLRGLAVLAVLFLIGSMPLGVGATVTASFDSMSEKLIYEQTTSFVGGATTQFEISNNTGLTWSDFHVRLAGDGDVGATYPFMRFTDLGSDGVIYYGAGTPSFSNANGDAYFYNEVMDVVGLTIPTGTVYSFSADIVGGVFPEGLTKVYIYANPTSGQTPPPIQTPEAATLILLGSGLMGLLGLKKRG
jgi:hypothetical protein